ncbi:MAG: phage portal protein [Alistipes sp.]|uniref:phage portal protein n=1 Tax=Alistipes sp. TaxID=1872444 RepID=UPI001B486F3F|nr:phage portal protein [Alistipes sp.]
MSKDKISTRVVATQNRAEPLLGSGSGARNTEKVWSWGGDNMLPYALSLLARRSVAHRRIINDKADYIAGKGFSYGEGCDVLAHLVDRANGSGESLRSILSRIAMDSSLFGNAFLEVVTDANHSFLSFYHIDASCCRVAHDSKHVVLHQDWSHFRQTESHTLPLYPLFEQMEDGTVRTVIHYKSYEPMFSHYGVAPYIAALDAAAIVYKTDRWNISRIDNAFQLSGVMMLDSVVDSEEEADRIVRMAEEKFAGNPGQVLFVLRDHAEGDNSRFIPIDAATDGDWQTLHTVAESDLVVAHSWFRSLSGLDYASGFSSDRILQEYEVALNTVILPLQEQLLEPIRAVIESVLEVDASTLEIINRPPSRSKPLYMRVWEARRADGLDYDERDPEQQRLLAEITKYNIRSIE